MTRSEIETLLEKHQAAFASRDPDALADLHAPQGTFRSPAAATAAGRDKILKVYEYWFDAFPDMTFTWESPIIDGDRAALFWKFAGTASGAPFFGDMKAGTRIQFYGAAEYTFSYEGILSADHVFDFTGALVTAGVLKIKPGS